MTNPQRPGLILLILALSSSFAISGCKKKIADASPTPTSSGTPAVSYSPTPPASILHNFGLTTSDGKLPWNDHLVVAGSTIYGMTVSGGSHNSGIIFSMGVDGSSYTLVHSFSGGASDGAYPYGPLLLSGNTLYGMTYEGGSGSGCGASSNGNPLTCGTIFSVGTDGTGFTLLHSFAGGAGDGAFPQGGLALSGSTLYGVTNVGGSGTTCAGSVVLTSCGVLFSIGTDGSSYSILHFFVSGTTDGGVPVGTPIISGNTLYGVTSAGGSHCIDAHGCGTVFSLATDGSNFSILHSFSLDSTDVQHPLSGLTLSGDTLYGMTGTGGLSGRGGVFSLRTDGTDFSVLHSFDYGPGNGVSPDGSLVASSGKLYGLTSAGGSTSQNQLGGAVGAGVLFEIGADGTGFNVLANFTGIGGDGATPLGTPFISVDTIYGMTQSGGAGTCSGNYNGCGTIFSFGL